MNKNRGHWYLLTGILIGVIFGIVILQIAEPPSSNQYSPGNLSDADKTEYMLMIARAYQVNEDLVRARARLDLLNEANPVQMLEQQAQRAMTSGGSENDAQALAELAADLREQQ
jgi:hypothetical protein